MNDDVKKILESCRPQKKSIKVKAKEALDNAVDFYNHNREFVIMVAVPTVVALTGLGKTAIRSAGRKHRTRVEDRAKRMRIYDPSLHSWWSLNHEMSNNERKMIDRRRRNGERLSDILADMKLI